MLPNNCSNQLQMLFNSFMQNTLFDPDLVFHSQLPFPVTGQSTYSFKGDNSSKNTLSIHSSYGSNSNRHMCRISPPSKLCVNLDSAHNRLAPWRKVISTHYPQESYLVLVLMPVSSKSFNFLIKFPVLNCSVCLN